MGCSMGKSPRGFRQEALQAHNDFRSRHGAPSLRLHSGLSSAAARHAAKLIRKRKLEHSSAASRRIKGGAVGENLAEKQGTATIALSGEEATRMWYDEIRRYNFGSPGFSSATGHFTQVVWKESKKLGVGVAQSRDKKTGHTRVVVVARYYPVGNVQSQFREQVLPPTRR